ncbi:plasmid recombination protein [Paramagnetospirillum marisnigri]|nr:plasmid recombination protein [Paramagnetospirillum marisnigri]
MAIAANDNDGDRGPFCILRHGRKSHTWGELRQAAQHTMRDAPWLGANIDPDRSPLNEVLVGSGDVVKDVRTRLAAVGLEPKPGQVVARELLLTASSTYFADNGHSGRDGDCDPDRLATWRSVTLDFLRAEFGDNLVTVVIHHDESVCHAHVWCATAVEVQKKGRGRPRKDGTKAATATGWTLNHDKIMGSGKEAFAARQDRYAVVMEPLGLIRGQRHSRAHHQPIREFYARIKEHEAAAVERQVEAHHARNIALMEEAKMKALRHAAEMAALTAKTAEQEAVVSHAKAQAAEAAAQEVRVRGEEAVQKHLVILADLEAQRDIVTAQKKDLGTFLERRGLRQEFESWQCDTRAVEALRNGKGDEEWAKYERQLAEYADELQEFGGWQAAMVTRARKRMLYLMEVGAKLLGHASILVNPSRLVSEGIGAWIRLHGGVPLHQRHRQAVRWLRDTLLTIQDVAMTEPERERGRER